MKTSVKILLLVLFSIGAIIGVLVFAKTRVAPPSNLDPIDQYSMDLSNANKSFDTISDFSKAKDEYVRLDDKMRRFILEGAMEPKVADEFRKEIDAIYGLLLITNGYDLLKKSIWPEEKLNEMLNLINGLLSDQLSTGEQAVNEDFIAASNRIKGIVESYHAALSLSRNTAYNGISDAISKIDKAKKYRTSEYLQNNLALVSALDILPLRISQSHYNHISNLIDGLGNYTNATKDYYMNTLIPRVDDAIAEYKSSKIYGVHKQNISDLENRAVNLVTAAMNYYGN